MLNVIMLSDGYTECRFAGFKLLTIYLQIECSNASAKAPPPVYLFFLGFKLFFRLALTVLLKIKTFSQCIGRICNNKLGRLITKKESALLHHWTHLMLKACSRLILDISSAYWPIL
jgi:hypothetical protein